MSYIIAEPCLSTRDTASVDVCPADCIYGGEDTADCGLEAKNKDLIQKVKCFILILMSGLNSLK
tara:strand:+ start:3703 stop:3894 length:192 start_codon:yes stop_codon:yes gene_type:complete